MEIAGFFIARYSENQGLRCRGRQRCGESRQISYSDVNQKGVARFLLQPLELLVRLAGIEPTTPWFVAKYSIQLSYSREKQNYIRALLILEEGNI
jgi:hypothetical protein